VVLGSAGLAEGFSLIGAEVHPDADPAKVEEVLGQLVRTAAKPWSCWNRSLAHAGGHWLNRLRNEGGRIVVTELPPCRPPTITPPPSMRWCGRCWARKP
jgi:hypothetical protein